MAGKCANDDPRLSRIGFSRTGIKEDGVSRGGSFRNMKITPALFEAYLKCPTKCWLRSTGEPSSGGSYPLAQLGTHQISQASKRSLSVASGNALGR